MYYYVKSNFIVKKLLDISDFGPQIIMFILSGSKQTQKKIILY